MTRREALVSAVAIFVIALVLRAIFAAQIVFPQPEDTAYYVGVARSFVQGHGFVTDALWSYQTPPLLFPRPAFEVWLPLPTFLAAIPMALFGTSFASAQISSVLVGSLVPVLSWRLAADIAADRGFALGRRRILALGTGLVTSIYLPLLLHSALPDSTMPFAVLALAACLLMARIARDPRGARLTDRRVWLLGVLIGLAALTRNEAIWVGLTWAIVAWWIPALDRTARLRLIGLAAVVAVLVFAPWAWRDWIVFGSPLPGQAAANALSVTGFDIFAWKDPPTLARYLAVGPERLLGMRIDGIAHNLLTVLTLPGIPLAVVGVAAFPWQARDRAIRPVVLVALITFAFTSLVFPVSTTWGTFLHAAGPAHVVVVIAALLTLDAGIARIAARLAWTRQMAWVGPMLGVFGCALFSIILLPTFGDSSRGNAATFAAIDRRLAEVGHPVEDAGPIITNFPIWMSDTLGVRALALPAESPTNVLDLARDPRFGGAHLLIIIGTGHGDHTAYPWPAALEGPDPTAACFRELDLGPHPSSGADPLADVRAFEIVCP